VIRDEYLGAIRAADDGDEGPLKELHLRFTPRQETKGTTTDFEL
jgi:hypothetical protein